MAPVVRVSNNVELPDACAALLLPMTKASEVGEFSAISESAACGVRGYRYLALQTTEFLFLAQGSTPWTCALWTSDAKLLYCKLERGRFTHVIMVGGSFGEWRGKRFVSHPSRSERFEWLNRPASQKAFSSESKLVEDSVLSDFEVFDSVT